MANGVDVIILCEDAQQEVFARRFLDGWGIGIRQIRVERKAKNEGAGITYVRKAYPKQLVAYRKRRNRSTDVRLIVVVDSDKDSNASRYNEFSNSRDDVDMVAIFTPKYNIETWIQAVLGNSVGETEVYPRFSGRERKPQAEIRKFARDCKSDCIDRNKLPPSLKAACTEFQQRFLGPDRV